MEKIKSPKFLGKVCIVKSGSFKGSVCMPTELDFNCDYSYSCLRIDTKYNTIDIEDVFAWVNEEDLELHPKIKDISQFQFLYDEEE